MADPVERLVSLAITIASASEPLPAAVIRARVPGYPAGQDDAAFMRMFERDKEDLRAAGLVLEVVRSADVEAYRIDPEATFAPELRLSAEEAMLVRAAGAAMLADPSFPRAADLRLALSKLAAGADSPVPLTGPAPVSALVADEEPREQAETMSELLRAQETRKLVSLTYDSPRGRRSRELEPYGLFAREGRWYVVARDRQEAALKVFALARMSDVVVSSRRPKEPDYEIPADFDVKAWMAFPFQWGGSRIDAVVRFRGAAAARASSLVAGQGDLEDAGDGSVAWRVRVSDLVGLVSWAVANGPGVVVEEPAEAREIAAQGLERVVESHGS